jgi:hypothetical protein
MKNYLGDYTTVRDACLHFFVADIMLSAVLGGSLEFIILFFAHSNALFLLHGSVGVVVESVVTWVSVLLSARLMRRMRNADSLGIALVSTSLSIFSTLIVVPYITYFSQVSPLTGSYLFIKEALHACIFYTATMIYFSGYSPRSLMIEY